VIAGALATTSTRVITTPARNVLKFDRQARHRHCRHQQGQKDRAAYRTHHRRGAAGDLVAARHHPADARQKAGIAELEISAAHRNRQPPRSSIGSASPIPLVAPAQATRACKEMQEVGYISQCSAVHGSDNSVRRNSPRSAQSQPPP
jgi:hypothetical protein